MDANQFCCILGVSGCGRSTILNILAGLIPPEGGEIHVRGRELGISEVRMGYVFQRPRLLNWKTVRQNLQFVLKARGVPREEWEERVGHHIRLVGLEDFADYYPLALSDVPRDREMEDPRLITLQKEIVASLGIE